MSESDSPQAIEPCELHARESQRLQPDRTPAEPSTRGEGTQRSEGTSEPVAWVAFADDASESGVTALNRQAVEEVAAKMGWHVAPLYRSPTLTDAEREAIEWALEEGVWSYGDPEDWTKAERLRAFLRGLLDRSDRT